MVAMILGLGYVIQAVQVSRTQVDRENSPAHGVIIFTGEDADMPVFPNPLPQRDKLVRYIRSTLSGAYDDELHYPLLAYH